METFDVTTGPLPGSEKIYVTGSQPDLRVPMRKIKLSPTLDLDGSKIEMKMLSSTILPVPIPIQPTR